MLTGCISTVRETKRIGEPEFEIVEKDAVPEEFARVIREEREKPFCLTYADQANCILPEAMEDRTKPGTAWKCPNCMRRKMRSCSIQG
uniref:hypothetical protein n=1 Tax=Mediterraneibacter glycyrrhizinilyticus TaxID=342942 RepID=UPI000B10F40E